MKRLELAIHADLTEYAKKIQVDTLLVYGKDDKFTRHGTESLAKLLPHASTIGLEGGHLPHISDPEAFSKTCLEFFQKN
jgi:pimeloyl-ACP methyl ester carboxylesterase